MKKVLIIIFSASLGGSISAQGLVQAPVHNKPVWQVVSGDPETPGAPVPIRSLSTNQVLGAIPVDSKFLSFGTNGQITTLAINGELVYVPAVSASPMYPQVPKVEVPPPGPRTLEEIADEYEDRVEGRAGVSLTLKDSLSEKSRSSEIIGQGANAGMPGSNYSSDPGINPQPGAALATGGIPAVGAMANPEFRGK